MRILHLGLGGFFRAHQAWYTQHSRDSAEWGIAAFGGRSASLAGSLDAQDGLYTLVTRRPTQDSLEVIASLSRAHAPSDAESWIRYFTMPRLAAVTVTVTEAGYHRASDGHLDTTHEAVVADIAALRRGEGEAARTAPGRLVAGLAARHRAGGPGISLVPCDNLPGNGAVTRRVVEELADHVDARLSAWIGDSVEVVGTVVDRITPRPSAEDIELVRSLGGYEDRVPLVTEPFSEWVLCGSFPLGRPDWESAGAAFTDDLAPFEHRKLWLLNGAHSLLAYAGSLRGHRTVSEAVDDPMCRGWTEQWWREASAHLPQPPEVLATYRGRLLERFGNPRMNDQLARIAEDGSQKLPVRVVPVLIREREAGRLPTGAATIVAAWMCHLRGMGAPVADVGAAEVVPLATGPAGQAVRRILAMLAPSLSGDGALVGLVEDRIRLLTGQPR